VAEAALGPRQLTARPRPAVSTLVPQVLDALFTCLRLQEDGWTQSPRSIAVSRPLAPAPPADPPASADVAGYATLFREGLQALGGILERVLRPATLEALRAPATGAEAERPPEISDEVWAAVMLELAAAHRHATISRDHLVRAAVPLYLGRVASFAAGLAGLETRDADERLEALCLHFERSRSDLVALWTAPSR
jgi:hypothetical protein